MRERANMNRGVVEGEEEARLLLSTEPDAGLNPGTPGS